MESELDFMIVRKERIKNLEKMVARISKAIIAPYKDQKDFLFDVASLEHFEKELQIQLMYQKHES
jgi:hypothetical protein